MTNSARYQAALVTISDRASQGEREDKSGKLLKELVEGRGYEVVDYQIIPDELPQIKNHILWLVDQRRIPLVFTTGGTGISPRDITPEATRAVIEKELPGFSEAMRASGRINTSLADISRAVCGIRGGSLIINLPGGPSGVRDGFNAICQAIDHVLGILSGKIRDCGTNKKVTS